MGPPARVDRDTVGVVVLLATEVGAVAGGLAVGVELGQERLAARLPRGWAAMLAAHGALERPDPGEVGRAGGAGHVCAAVLVDVDAARDVGGVATEVGAVDNPLTTGGQLGDEPVVGAGQVTLARRALELRLERVVDREVERVGDTGEVHIGVLVDGDSERLFVASAAEVRGPDDAA